MIAAFAAAASKPSLALRKSAASASKTRCCKTRGFSLLRQHYVAPAAGSSSACRYPNKHHSYSSMSIPMATATTELETYDEIPTDIRDLVNEYCTKKQTPVTMKDLVKTGRQELVHKSYRMESIGGSLNRQNASSSVLIQVANFLRNELPVRLAHRINDLDQVPMMRDMPSVQLVKSIYINSFVDLVKYPTIMNNQDEAAFAHFLNQKYEMHANVLIQMARGAYEFRKLNSNNHHHQQHSDYEYDSDPEYYSDSEFSQMEECHAFLDRFYMSRIGIRVLAGQYLALRQTPMADYTGMICLKTSPYQIVKQAARDATFMCERRYGQAPEVIIDGRLDLTFPYIPTYLHYILLELLKNAMRATVERHLEASYSDSYSRPASFYHHYDHQHQRFPPVMVIIADGQEQEDVVIKVADVGGGIPRSNMSKIWSYLFTTADPSIQEDFIGDQDHDPNNSPLAGLGFGLPISRSYARYFKGDLNIMSMEGYGTDAYIHLARLEDPNQEFS